MINGFGCIFRACNSGLKNSAGVLQLSAERLAQDGKLLSFNGFHVENCWTNYASGDIFLVGVDFCSVCSLSDAGFAFQAPNDRQKNLWTDCTIAKIPSLPPLNNFRAKLSLVYAVSYIILPQLQIRIALVRDSHPT
jgi:hypothetical protein